MNLLIVKSQYMYAKNSFEIRQEDRFNEAIGYYNEFIEAYPNSSYAKEANQLKENSESGIVNAKKILAEQAAAIAKYDAFNKKSEKKKDTTTNKIEIKNP